MAYAGYNWTPLTSMTAMKYQKYGYVDMRPFEPGERRRAGRELERTVKGYKELSLELARLGKEIDKQKKRNPALEKAIETSYYKSPVGTR